MGAACIEGEERGVRGEYAWSLPPSTLLLVSSHWCGTGRESWVQTHLGRVMPSGQDLGWSRG
jgi:hypothetical protein